MATITLSTSLVSIGNAAFSDCTALTKIFIPSSVTSISASNKTNSPFYGCSNLTIYCEVESKPDGWGIYWNYLDDSNTITTYWGQTLSDYEAA